MTDPAREAAQKKMLATKFLELWEEGTEAAFIKMLGEIDAHAEAEVLKAVKDANTKTIVRIKALIKELTPIGSFEIPGLLRTLDLLKEQSPGGAEKCRCWDDSGACDWCQEERWKDA